MARFLFLTFGPGTDDNKSEIRRGAARTEFIFSTEDALAPAIAHGEKPEQIAERGDEGGDVGEGCGVEHIVYPRDLSARLHDPHLLQNNFGAARCIKFYRKRDQLKDQQNGVTINAKRNQPGNVKK